MDNNLPVHQDQTLILAKSIEKLTKSSVTNRFDFEKSLQEPQISSLARFNQKQTAGTIVRLLIQSSIFLPYRGTGSPFVDWAEMILNNFSWLRVDEFAHILNQGINGNFGRDGKIYGELTYSFIAEWIQLYTEGEREEKILQKRIAEQSAAKQEMKNWKTDFTPLIEKFTAKELEEKKTITKPRPLEQIDSEQADFILVHGKDFSPEEIALYKSAAEKNGYAKTLALLEKIITPKTDEK